MSGPVLRVEGLQLRLRGDAGDPLVRGVDVTVNAGEITAIVGESGSGKTLTALAAIGLLPPAIQQVAGDIHLGDLDCTGFNQKQWRGVRGRRISMVFQEPMTALDPVFKVGEVLRELLSLDGLRGGAARIRALALLEEVRIPDPERCFKSPPHLLSGGMRQRVVLAMALARSPQVLLADEPTTALDTVTRNAIMDLLESMCTRRDLGMLLITHDLSLVAKRVHRLIVMCAGCVCEAGSAQAILADPRHPYTRGLLGCRLSVERRFDHLGHLSDVIDDPGAWAPQTTAEGQATPFWPHARPGGPVDRQPSAMPRLVMVGDDHMLAV